MCNAIAYCRSELAIDPVFVKDHFAANENSWRASLDYSANHARRTAEQIDRRAAASTFVSRAARRTCVVLCRHINAQEIAAAERRPCTE